jgi:hypothetical protein
MATIAEPITACPACGSEVWDNRGKKKTPKSPDFKCKACAEAYWLKGAKAPAKPAAKAAPAEPLTNGVGELVKLYDASFRHVMKLVAEQNGQPDPPVVFTDQAVHGMTATLFIALSQHAK